MKYILSALALATMMTFSVNAADEKKPTTEKKYTAGSCCDKAQKAGKACEHKCCVEAPTFSPCQTWAHREEIIC
jgi:hypothetical protein